jgi:putative tRNA adenosine deaminase-associated protein
MSTIAPSKQRLADKVPGEIVSYFAVGLARTGAGWTGEEVDLGDVEDLDGVVDALRQAVGDDSNPALLLVEQDDEWFAIVRVDDDSDPRVFVSDGRVVETSTLGAIFGEAATINDDDADDDDVEDDDDDADDEEEDPIGSAGDPVGDSDLMSDLGTSSARLLALCAEEGQLPADILSAVCEQAGCLDTLEALRGG